MKIKKSLAFKISILVMLIAFIAITIFAYLNYQEARKIFIQNSQELLAKDLNDYVKEIQRSLNSLKNDLLIISSNPLIQGALRAYNDPFKYDEKTNRTYTQYQKDLINTLKLLLTQNEPYFQIRILNLQGDELV